MCEKGMTDSERDSNSLYDNGREIVRDRDNV
jgi:hypothetical protein